MSWGFIGKRKRTFELLLLICTVYSLLGACSSESIQETGSFPGTHALVSSSTPSSSPAVSTSDPYGPSTNPITTSSAERSDPVKDTATARPDFQELENEVLGLSTFPTSTALPPVVSLPEKLEELYGQYITAAFWAEDETGIYYAISSDPPTWFAYNVVTMTLEAAIKVPRLPYPLSLYMYPSTESYYDVIKGAVSPSEHYRLEEIPEKTDGVQTEYGIWLVDGVTNTRKKVAEGGFITKAMWFDEENQVMFCLSIESGCMLYVADTQFGEARRFEDIFLSSWLLSPDGKKLAYYEDLGFNLHVVNLDTKDQTRITNPGELVGDFHWSGDGLKLFYMYYRGGETGREGDIRVYNLVNGKDSLFVPADVLQKSNFCGIGCSFDISASEKKVLVWSSEGVWVLEQDSSGYTYLLQIGNKGIFDRGDLFVVTEAGANLNLRAEPGLDAKILTRLQSNTLMIVTDDPIFADGHTWWKVRILNTEHDFEGWVADNPDWLQKLQ